MSAFGEKLQKLSLNDHYSPKTDIQLKLIGPKDNISCARIWRVHAVARSDDKIINSVVIDVTCAANRGDSIYAV